MKKVFSILAAFAFVATVACGPNAEEAKKKAEQDSIAMADSMAKAAEAAKAAEMSNMAAPDSGAMTAPADTSNMAK